MNTSTDLFLKRDWSHLINLAKQDTDRKVSKLTFSIPFDAPIDEQIEYIRRFYGRMFKLVDSPVDLKTMVDFYINQPGNDAKRYNGGDWEFIEHIVAPNYKEVVGHDSPAGNHNKNPEEHEMFVYREKLDPENTTRRSGPAYLYFTVNKTEGVTKRYDGVPYGYKRVPLHADKGKYPPFGKFQAIRLSSLYTYYTLMKWLETCPEATPDVMKHLVRLKSAINGNNSLTSLIRYDLQQQSKYQGRRYEPEVLKETLEEATAITEILKGYTLHTLAEHLQYVSYITTQDDTEGNMRKYAKTFQTKSHINKETQEMMDRTTFRQNFSFVELDNMVDLDKFIELDRYYVEFATRYSKLLPQTSDGVSLRFRRLGNHRAHGLYFPAWKTIAVDVRTGAPSFVHELGHYHDYRFDNISMTEEFIQKVVVPFVEKFEQVKKDYAGGMYQYYISAVEVFARAFELYFKFTVLEGGNSMFVKETEEYQIRPEYNYLISNYAAIKEVMDQVFARIIE